MTTRRQRWIERLLAWSPVLLLGALAGMTYWLNTQVRPTGSASDGSGRHDPDLIADNFKGVSLDENGRVRLSLSAVHAQHSPDDDTTSADEPVIVVTDPGKPRVDVTADHGTVTGDREHAYLQGHVKLVRQPMGGEEPNGPLTVTSDYFHVFLKEERAVTDRPATISDPRFTANAIGLEFDNKANTVKFKSRLSGQLQPQHQSP
jgi:lipopolysaccharide export system protein LptC